MDVSVTDLRANLSSWLDRVSAGDDVVVTDRGVPVARLSAVHATPLIERLVQQGAIARPRTNTRPKAAGRHRPRVESPVSDLVSEQRD